MEALDKITYPASVMEVAAALRLRSQQVRDAIYRGDLRAYRAGYLYRLERRDVEAWLKTTTDDRADDRRAD